uniref:Uncharacterized protein n=1 Tax=Anguilla anguilla TaxID=7936 RepID=A0A0E9V2P9_ANGAN
MRCKKKHDKIALKNPRNCEAAKGEPRYSEGPLYIKFSVGQKSTHTLLVLGSTAT